LLKEKITDPASWQIEIMATDIDTDILETAKRGKYSGRSVRFVSPYIKSKYFTPAGEDYLLSPQVKQMVEFQHLNLADSVKMRFVKNVDFIFCRNVLIYFDEQSRRAVVANFYDSLKPGD
jgi:chemotaxis protein methyltransferase CheR